jgi:uncharacterized membrane protein YqjE
MLGNSLTKFLKLDSLIGNLTGYVETKIELIKVEVKQDLAEGLGKVIGYLLIAFVFAMVIMFLSLGVAIVLSNHLGDFAGFGIVAGFYLIIGIVLFANRDALSSKFTKQVSQTLKKK